MRIARFRSKKFDVKEAYRSGRPVTQRANEILRLIKQDPHASWKELAEALHSTQMTIWNHLKKCWPFKVWRLKFGMGEPHELVPNNLVGRIMNSEIVLRIAKIVMDDEKWIKDENMKQNNDQRQVILYKRV